MTKKEKFKRLKELNQKREDSFEALYNNMVVSYGRAVKERVFEYTWSHQFESQSTDAERNIVSPMIGSITELRISEYLVSTHASQDCRKKTMKLLRQYDHDYCAILKFYSVHTINGDF